MKTLLTLVISLLIVSSPVLATTISMNFAENTNQVFAGGELIGPLATDSANWNNSEAKLPNGTMDNLLQDIGGVASATSATVTWTAPNCWYNGDGTLSDEARLAVGYLDDGGAGNSAIVTSIPYAEYDAYILFTSDKNGDYIHAPIIVNGVDIMGGDFNAHGRVTDGTGWVESDGTVYGNYIRLPNLTGDLEIASMRSNAGRGPLTGFILQEVPEPATMVLMGLGGLLLSRKRK